MITPLVGQRHVRLPQTVSSTSPHQLALITWVVSEIPFLTYVCNGVDRTKLCMAASTMVTNTAGGTPILCDSWEVIARAHQLCYDHACMEITSEAAKQAAAVVGHDKANESMVHSCPDQSTTAS